MAAIMRYHSLLMSCGSGAEIFVYSRTGYSTTSMSTQIRFMKLGGLKVQLLDTPETESYHDLTVINKVQLYGQERQKINTLPSL